MRLLITRRNHLNANFLAEIYAADVDDDFNWNIKYKVVFAFTLLPLSKTLSLSAFSHDVNVPFQQTLVWDFCYSRKRCFHGWRCIPLCFHSLYSFDVVWDSIWMFLNEKRRRRKLYSQTFCVPGFYRFVCAGDISARFSYRQEKKRIHVLDSIAWVAKNIERNIRLILFISLFDCCLWPPWFLLPKPEVSFLWFILINLAELEFFIHFLIRNNV